MDCCLIAVGWTDPKMWFAALEVTLGLGFIIFVHELGHFAVAKMCGVKVDKFFIGFDIGGLKLCSFRWGETLYGIGILPLGGYVKMLGQEDNPAQLRKEMERARQEAAANPAAGGTDGGAADAGQTPDNGEPSAEKRLYDPRSYLAKSVPQRMAIISAGVIMNLVSALLFAVVAFLIGVKEVPTIVGSVMGGGAAWQAGIQVDDEVKEVAGHKVDHWQQMTDDIHTGDVSHGLAFLVQRPGITDPLEIVVKPEQLLGMPTIGIGNSFDLKLMNEKNALFCLPESAAADAKVPFLAGDRIVRIDDRPINTYGDLQDFLVAHADEDLAVTVARMKQPGAKEGQPEDTENVKVMVPKSPMKQFGMVMEMGAIAAVQTDSPAAKAGIQPGDLLKTVDGKEVPDPMRLPDEFHKKAGTEIVLGLKRGGKPLEMKVKLQSKPQNTTSIMPDTPVALSELGAAYYVLNTVARVEPGSPAAEAGLTKGDQLTKVTVISPPAEQLTELRKKYHNNDLEQDEIAIKFAEKERNWPSLMLALQGALPGTTVEFTWQREGKELSGKAAPVRAKDWFDSERGWLLEPKMFVQKGGRFPGALRLAAHETAGATMVVYRSLHGLVGTKQISIRNLGGPWTIIRVALMKARLGFGNFLIFLTLISANLAVINFLPIPVLDGGHMMLLLYEGIRGKPADERVQEVLTWIGLIFILSLMVFVFGLDFGLISRPGAH